MPELDPAMAQILRAASTTPAVDLLDVPLEAARAAFEDRWRSWNEPALQGLAESVVEIETPEHSLRARVFRPDDAGALRVIYLHGGGWIFGSPESHAALTRHLASAARATVVSLDYRRSPEHPWPAAMQDALAVIQAIQQGSVPGVAPGPVALAGDSAGASVALSAALAHVRGGGQGLAALALFYGCYAPDFTTQSYVLYGEGNFGLSRARMEHFWRVYAGPLEAQRVAPGLDDLAGLPPVYLNAAALDVLRDDSIVLAGRLAQAGAAVRLDVVSGVVHGYAQMVSRLPAAARALADAGAWLQRNGGVNA